MTKIALKIGPLPDRTPVKLSLLIDPALKADLEVYASLYEEAYGDRVALDTLVPVMLQSFIESDGAFRRAVKQIRSEPQSKLRTSEAAHRIAGSARQDQ